MERPQESERSMEIPIEILQDIFTRLPIKDVVRSSCVSKLWCRIVGDPSFRNLHAADDHAAAPSESSSEALLVSINREPGRRDEASFFNLSSGKAMRRAAIPSGYTLTGVCNGFLSFALDYDQAPVVVCNPVTGETVQLPKAPPLSVSRTKAGDIVISGDGGDDVIQMSHHYVLGFSPSTREYKMFRFSFPRYTLDEWLHFTSYIAVYTLDGGGGGVWRQYSYFSHYRQMHSSPLPVYIDGRLYVTVERDAMSGGRAARMLVLDVATETRSMYSLPYNYDDYTHTKMTRSMNYDYTRAKMTRSMYGRPFNYDDYTRTKMLANGFDLNGQMCLAVDVLKPHRREVQFWVMAPPGVLQDKADDDDKLYWDLRYSFYIDDDPFYFNAPSGACLDHAQMLCYMHGNSMYKHSTRAYSSSSNAGPLLFGQQLQLPEASSSSSSSSDSAWSPSCRWNICGGYRPSLLSPLIFALTPSEDEKVKKRQLEDSLLRALTQSSKRRRVKGSRVGHH